MMTERLIYGGVSLFLLLFLLAGIDMYGGHKTRVTGVVVGRDYSPETTTYQLPANGQGGALVPVLQPAQYYLVLHGPHGVVSIATQPYDYFLPQGTPYNYSESRGLLTGHLYSF